MADKDEFMKDMSTAELAINAAGGLAGGLVGYYTNKFLLGGTTPGALGAVLLGAGAGVGLTNKYLKDSGKGLEIRKKEWERTSNPATDRPGDSKDKPFLNPQGAAWGLGAGTLTGGGYAAHNYFKGNFGINARAAAASTLNDAADVANEINAVKNKLKFSTDRVERNALRGTIDNLNRKRKGLLNTAKSLKTKGKWGLIGRLALTLLVSGGTSTGVYELTRDDIGK